ncbi:EAL domain, c-di-GMP-specific phosphodiesterase class I (or its enzymatically inactive variant) [Nocardioides terrae]|uniref:EAL domain, c-di-GMP-specific phosphodiesterase class I (Or its enzymatically inactive variant) n=1 Tax=Nocardioides terrae TaxID=574651 RepID=A0A1I1EY06_9ACTN|nr:bifunctional diguanylate cyclase/phosphodiesterase [Nocardioides terrae]SFB91542.1 EAL domain, c-di-GMP-specific phosphodiesterase class I (or its enzymatically inactive variant) [Nocardioides terrae]
MVPQHGIDPTTGLPHYEAAEAASLGPRTAAVLVVEVDGHAITTHVVGPEAGEALLVDAAERVVRAAEALGGEVRRLGDPHFVVFAPTADDAVIHDVASHLALVNDRPAALDAGALTVGIAVAPRDGTDVPTLVRAGMVAVAHGRVEHPGTAVFYEQAMADGARERFSVGRALRMAIDRREIELVYQPQLDLVTGAVVGVEVLARWTDAECGVISPTRFVKIADELGMTSALDRLVFDKATEQLRKWDDAGVWVPRMSINVSPDTLRSARIPDAAVGLLVRRGIGPERITVELIESRLLEADIGLQSLRRLRELGVKVSLDDFGTGYASFSQVVTLPIDELKIDRGFLADTADSAASLAVIAAITRVGQTLGLTVVAEGIERIEQHEMLRALACPIGQGYLYSPPLPADELVRWLARREALHTNPQARPTVADLG